MKDAMTFYKIRTEKKWVLIFIAVNLVLQNLIYFEYYNSLKAGEISLLDYCFHPLLSMGQIFIVVIYCSLQASNLFSKNLIQNLLVNGLTRLAFVYSILYEVIVLTMLLLVIKLLFFLFFYLVNIDLIGVIEILDIVYYSISFILASFFVTGLGLSLTLFFKSAVKGIAVFYGLQVIEQIVIRVISISDYTNIPQIFPYYLRDSLLKHPEQFLLYFPSLLYLTVFSLYIYNFSNKKLNF